MFKFPSNRDRLPLYKAIGQIAIHWALLEFSLDAITNMFFTHAGGNKMDKSMPSSLSKKTDFIKRCLAKNRGLAKDFPETRQLMIDIDQESKLRNNVIHGYMAGIDTKTKKFHFVKLKLKKNLHTEDRQLYIIQQLIAGGKMSLSLSTRTNAIAQKVLDKIMA